MWLEYNPQIILVTFFFSQVKLSHFSGRYYIFSESIVVTLCAPILLQFYADCFETLQVFCLWSEAINVAWI